ncbi:MAG: GNAT family N-acetyltransferase [Thermoleophilia bacterium]
MEVIGARDYTPDQVAAWAALAPSPETLRARFRDGRTALVAVDDADRPVAYGDVEQDGHIDLLYCAPQAAGRGIGAAIATRLEEAARAAGATRMTVEASEAARRLFLRRGFRELHRRDLDLGGVAIHNVAMEKDLGAEPPA